MGWTHDAAGALTSVTQPGGVTFAMTNDPLGRMTGASWTAPGQGWTPFFGIGRDDLGQRTSTGWASSATTYAHDAAGRLTGLGQQFAGSVGNDSATLGYNPAGQITSRTSTNDAYAWTGAANVNRTDTIDGLNRLTNAGGVVIGHDARGNVASSGAAQHPPAGLPER